MTIDLNELFRSTPNLNDKVFQKLLAAIQSGHSAEFDYLKFKKSYLALKDMGMDEVTAMKSAFMTASTMGLTKEKLIHNVDHYKSLLLKEREQFAHALKHQISSNIDARTMAINKLQNVKEDNERKIIELQNQREIIDSEIDKINKDIEVSTQKIHSTRDQFKETFDFLFNVIEEDQSQFKSIL